MSFRVQFWGTRGSIPSPGPRTVRYGGNTPCVELHTAAGHLLILDAETGVRELGRALIANANGAPITGDIFVTHAHWDHIQGFPFFAPIFQSGNRFTIWGAEAMEKSIDRVVRDQMSPVVFPVRFDELDAVIDFRRVTVGDNEGNGYRVRAIQVRHPGGALGYRFTEAESRDGRAEGLVYISDNELGPGLRYDSPPGWRDDLVEFIRGARVLIHDAMYTVREYDHHRGWGHSTFPEAVDLAVDANVETLVLFHHKPERSDTELEECVAECQARASARGSLNVIAAAEGLTLTV